MTHSYGDKPHWFTPAPRPTNLDALTAAAAARDSDLFAAEHAKYADQAARAGAHPGQLLGVIDENGNVT